MAERVMLAAALAVAMVATASSVHASAGSPAQEKKPPQVVFNIPPISERIEIDGRKNPEMIPQWDVWHAAFELMAAKSDLPTELWNVLSKEEVTLVLQAGHENAKNFMACQQRVLQLVPTLQTEEAKFVNERTQAINLEFRWQVLGLRDRVLAALPPPGQTALTKYVESLKEGIRVFVPKNELAFYRQPQ